ncbi:MULTISPECIES: type I-C CRISPR-associated endonuclease Cas1c [Anoxynatronum]|uniref:CRISPR-associated endonuclease Cas1 n=2 Tax=Anoxynatronum TaxID=210622 RepID=A0AA45WXV8_9CLOT|nr:type I-C CRISPR-associated endonuclease Cas1c [Anoxynatronum buryatiense]SMP64753.1 CRISPR-associated protein, Cas1 family [Anoxynatronum buryatiense]
MRKLLNTLYVTSSDAHLGKEGENVVIRVDDEIRFRVPIHNLESIVTMGYTGASPALMNLCAERGVSLAFHTTNARLLARVTPAGKGNVLLRKRQYEMHDSEDDSVAISKSVIVGKLTNARAVLNRFTRDYKSDPGVPSVESTANHLKLLMPKVLNATSLDELRGIEGDGARQYFSVFRHLILQQKQDFSFEGRSRRPPMDRVNALLSFLYSMLTHDCASALETVGLDSQVGFLHRLRPGRASLALDIMEELRPYMADRLALSLINNRLVSPKDFIEKETGAFLLKEDSRKTVIDAWQKRKQQQVHHPYMQEKVEIGLLPYCQALLMARCIRGDLDLYPPYRMS